MIHPANEDEKKRAQQPHNLFISGVFLFDLLMTPAAIALKIGMYGLLLPLTFSLAMIAYIFLRSRHQPNDFVGQHWRLAFSHCRWLMAGYAVSAVLILLAWLLSSTTGEHMQNILWVALTRIAILPTLGMVMVTLLAEAGAQSNAGKGEGIESIK